MDKNIWGEIANLKTQLPVWKSPLDMPAMGAEDTQLNAMSSKQVQEWKDEYPVYLQSIKMTAEDLTKITSTPAEYLYEEGLLSKAEQKAKEKETIYQNKTNSLISKETDII